MGIESYVYRVCTQGLVSSNSNCVPGQIERQVSICVPLYVCPDMCALICVPLYVCPDMCVLICVPLYECAYTISFCLT